MKQPKTICIDFDGVIHSYKSGWQGADIIPDAPVDGAIEGLYRLAADPEIDIAIHSARSAQSGGVQAMLAWLDSWDLHYRETNRDIKHPTQRLIDLARMPTDKPPAMCYIDDRGVNFDGDWSKITAELKDFTPWNKV